MSGARGMIDWLYGLRHGGIKLGLDTIRALVDGLDRPDRAYRVVHVAGTNGKGSVAAMIDAVASAAGLHSGLFTSPHLVRPNERIRLDGRDIGDDELARQLRTMRRRIGELAADGRLPSEPSFFETITATALVAFRDAGMELAVLEVGLGGRLDATNVCEPDVGVIVSIDLDHTKTLGPTLSHIAREKAGIVKPGLRVVGGIRQVRAREVVRAICEERGAAYADARQLVRRIGTGDDAADGGFALELRGVRYDGLRLPLAGAHQIDNARVALVAADALFERLGRRLDPDALRRGLASVRWPGRLQWVRHGATRLLLDAAHNPAGLRTLAAHLDRHDLRPAVVLFGATAGKPLDRLLGPLGRRATTCVLTQPPVDRSLPVDELAPIARRHFTTVEAVDAPASALPRAVELAGPDGWVLVTGSLYLVGIVAGLLEGRPVPGPIAL